MKKFLKWAVIGVVGLFAALILLGVVVQANKSPEEKAADAARLEQRKAEAAAEKEQAKADAAQQKLDAEKAAIEALPAVTAKELAVAYEENTVAADQQFKGKRFRVSGTVDSISTDLMGDPYVTLRGGVNQFMEPQFAFGKSDLEAIGTLRKGQKVELACVGKGDIVKTPMSGDCSLL